MDVLVRVAVEDAGALFHENNDVHRFDVAIGKGIPTVFKNKIKGNKKQYFFIFLLYIGKSYSMIIEVYDCIRLSNNTIVAMVGY